MRILARYSIAFILTAVLMIGTAFADDSTGAPASAEQTTVQETAQTSAPAPAPVPAAPAETVSDGNVTIDFKDADIQNVLRIISMKSGMNIVAGKDVTGTVTIRLVDVPWEKALDVVMKTYGYAYDRDENIIRVTTLENLQREELSTEVFVLNYASAVEVEKSVKDILSERGKARSDVRSNTVIVTDMATVIQRVQKVIERLDRSTPQVMINTKVVELTLGDADKLGIKWNVHAAANGSLRPSTFPFSAIGQTGSMLNQLFPIGRVQTQTSLDTGSGSSTTQTTEDFPAASFAKQPTFPVADKVEYKFGAIDFSEFQAIFEMIQQRGDAKILSEPHVTVLNNQEAKVLVGEIIAIPTFERNLTTGRMEITGYKDRDLGIRLSVTPQINAQNEIVVSVTPEITALVGYDSLTTDVKAPHFTTRSAKTQVRIKDGQTIVIGGLIKEDTVDSRTQIPVLGDIPLVGKMFKHKEKTVQKTDLLFFMTVNVVSDTKVPTGHKL